MKKLFGLLAIATLVAFPARAQYLVGPFKVVGTPGTTMTFPTTSATVARTDAAQTFTGAQTFPNVGLRVLDTNASHGLIIKPGSNITADRTLTVTTGDADRTLTLSANVAFSNALTFAGTDGTTMTFPGTNATIARTDAVNTFTGDQSFSGAVKSTSPTAGIGYATGAGGAVVQDVSKATGVTSNTVTTAITMNAAELAAGAVVSFTFTNSAIAATDQVIVTHESGGTNGAYFCNAFPGSGSASIAVRNLTAGNLSEAVVLRVTVIKAVSS